MTLPMFAAALDTAAVGAMVSIVGTYTLDTLQDSELRAQHKRQCAERLKTNNGGAQVQYSEQAILANLEWGVDALEEAITTNNDETKVARLDHAEKMLQIGALLDGRSITAGVPNCYLSGWAHFNLAFVWKLRGNDHKAANHMLEMFLVDPFYSRVDFAPALWEHLILPHLSNIVNWYTKQRKSIVVSGTLRKMSEEIDMSVEMSRDFSMSDSANVLDLSANQTSQLQALEKLYQDSLDENTRQYARYYRDWLNYDMANKKGMPLMPIAEPPMSHMIAESWTPLVNLPTEQVPSSTGITLPVAEPIQLGQETTSSPKSLPIHSLATLPPLTEFKDLENPEFVELAELPNFTIDGLDSDPDSPNSNFRKPGMELQDPMPTTTSDVQSDPVEHMVDPASTDENTPSSPRLLRSNATRVDPMNPFGSGTATTQPSIPNTLEIRSVPNSDDIRTDSAVETLGDVLDMKLPRRRSSFRQQPNASDYYPARSSPTTVDSPRKSLSERRDNSSSPRKSHDSLRGQMSRRASRLNNASSSRYSNLESKDRSLDGRADSERHDEESDLDLSRHSASQQSERFNQSGNASPGGSSQEESVYSLRAPIAMPEVDSSNENPFRASTAIREGLDFSDFSESDASGASQIQESKVEPRQKNFRDSHSSIRATGIGSTTRRRFKSKYGNLGFEGSSPSSRWYQNDDDRSGPLPGRASERYQDDDDEPIVARSGPVLGGASEGYQDDSDEPIVARSRPLLGTTSKRYPNDDDQPIVARFGPLHGRASERDQDDDDESIVARSGPLLGTTSEMYQTDDHERNIAYSGPLLGGPSEMYQNNDEEPIAARSGPLLRNQSSSMNSTPARSQRHRRSGSLRSVRNSTMATPLTRPPKDFVCPITSQLFNDPVTLETGQTYERIAIQEWLNRGNVTCPITRQKLRQKHLPKTNYVLKRLVDSWKEQYPELAMEFGSSPLLGGTAATIKPSSEFSERSFSSSPYMDSPGSEKTSRRFSKGTSTNKNVSDRSRPPSPIDVDGLIMDLKPAMSSLCTSENLAECESVIMEIARLILQARGDERLVSILNRAGAISGMMELLFNSQEVRVLNATLFLLSIVIAKDDIARQTVVSADPEAGCLVGLLKKGFPSSASVLYQVKLPIEQLASLDLLPLLVVVIKENEENQGGDVGNELQDIHSLMMRPKSAAIMLLNQIMTGGDQANLLQNAQALLALQAVPAMVSSLDQTKDIDVRTNVISLLLCCIQSDGRSRNMISKMTNLATVVDLLHSGNNRARTIAITFLNNLVHLNRRALCTDILRKLKAEGNLSSMRVLLVYLQMAPLEHRPVAASLLLELDLLEEPRKQSMYREEAVESLVEALTSTEWPCPAEAANMLIALGGRFSYSGKPLMKAWLLKIAGIDKYFLSLTKNEQDSNDNDSTFDQEEEEKAAKAWERRVAGALVGHDLGTLIEALGQGIQSKNRDVSKPCMIVATWLSHMLPKLPDTGIREIARNCLLDHFVGVLQTSKDIQQRVLAALAVQSFISDPEGVQELISYVKDISGPLRQLKKSTWTAKEILRSFTTHGDANLRDLWVHSEQGQLDATANGEVRALVRAKTRIFSGHSDGTIKIWEAKKRFPVLLQELKEHSKSVMALTVSLNLNRMYSGSLDKSIRVWALGAEDIHCVHVFELKDAVVGLLFNGQMACIIPYGPGLKVQYEETATKTLNSNKHVQSLAISDGKIFCGCADHSVQELDPISESVDVIQHGVRTLMGKKPIYATQVFQDHLYVAGAPVDGVAGQVRKLSDYSLVGTLCTTSEVRSMAVSEDFIYLGSSSGVIEVWLRERLLRVSTLNAGSKVISLMLDGDILYSGHEDGKIRLGNFKDTIASTRGSTHVLSKKLAKATSSSATAV